MARVFTGAGGSGAYLSTTTIPVDSYPFTIACWFWSNDPSFGNPTQQGLVHITSGAAFTDNIGFSIHTDTQELFPFVSDSAGSYHGPAGFSVSANTWYAAVYTGTNATTRKAYMTGASPQNDTASNVFTPNTANNFLVGALSFSGIVDFAYGRIAEVAVWNAVLTDGEANAYIAGVRAYLIRPNSLVGYWPLDGLSSPEPDLSGKKANLTLTNSPAQGNNPPMTLWTPKTPFQPLTLPAIAAPTVMLFGGQSGIVRRVRMIGY